MSAILGARVRRNAAIRHRPKIAATVDPLLLKVVDAWLRKHPAFDRSKVIDEALRLWYARLQQKAMEEQFTSPSGVDAGEWEAWRKIRDAAASQRLRAPNDA